MFFNTPKINAKCNLQRRQPLSIANHREYSHHADCLINSDEAYQQHQASVVFLLTLNVSSSITMSARSLARGTSNSTQRKKKRTETFNLYIFKVLKQVHPDIGMSKRAMNVMNGFVHDTFDRIANEAGNIVKYNKRSTMDARAVQCACKLVLSGDLKIRQYEVVRTRSI